MKRFFTTIGLCSLLAFPMLADLNGTGFYRVKNYATDRWASLVDNTAEIDKTATTVDLHAMLLTKDTEFILSDPGSVLYFENVGSSKYDIASQGTSLEDMVGYSVSVKSNGTANGQTLYRVYGTYNGVTRYIADKNIAVDEEIGQATVENVSNAKFAQWFIVPIDVNSTNYYGPVPDITVDGNMYTTVFASFAYKPVSSNVKAYYIGRVGFGMAEIIEVSGAVPAGSPVIIQCAGTSAGDNKMEILTSPQTALPNNSLSGAYFDYYYSKNLNNQIKYDPETMRVLGECSDGSLGFITASDLKTIPANTAYLTVPKGSSPEFKCVSSQEYDDNLPVIPTQITVLSSVDSEDGSMILYPQNEYTFSGSFKFPESEYLSFTFEATLENGDIQIIGAESDDDVTLDNPNASYPFSYGSESAWIINDWKGGDVSISLNLINQTAKFDINMAGIESVAGDKNGVRFANNTVYCDSPASISVYNLTGQMMVSSFGETLSLNHLQKGIYIVKANGKVIKVMIN